MKQRCWTFLNCEDGAVTVDWVVLCAGIVAMAAAIFSQMETGAMGLTNDVTSYMGTQDPN